MAGTNNATGAGAPEDLLAEAEAAEAEAAQAEAEAAAARARARAVALRRQADERSASQPTPTEVTEDSGSIEDAGNIQDQTEPAEDTGEAVEDPESAAGSAEDTGDETDSSARSASRLRRLRAPNWTVVAVSLGVLALVSLLALSGAMIWQHRHAVQRDQNAAEFTAAARQGVTNLMSLNFNSAQTDLQRVIDSTTGSFRDDFQNSFKDFMTVMQESKVVTTSDVKATGVESINGDSAVVLIAATSQVRNSASKEPTPRAWRLSVTVNKVDGGIKMSKVEFVP